MLKPFSISLLLLYVVTGACSNRHITAISQPVPGISVLTMGEPPDDIYEQHVIAFKYGFRLVGVAGCITTEELDDSVAAHNTMAYRRLEKRNGRGWQEKYYADVKAAYTRDTAIIAWLEKEPFFVQKTATLDTNYYGIHLRPDTTLPHDICRVHIAAFKKQNEACVSFYRLYVDTKRKKIVRKEKSMVALDF